MTNSNSIRVENGSAEAVRTGNCHRKPHLINDLEGPKSEVRIAEQPLVIQTKIGPKQPIKTHEEFVMDVQLATR